MLSLPLYLRGSVYYLHTRINGEQVKRSLRTGYRSVAIMRAVSLLNDLHMSRKLPPSTYTLDIEKGVFQADGEEDHRRMMEAAALALQLRNSAPQTAPVAPAPAPLPQADHHILNLGELLEKFFTLRSVQPATVKSYRNTIQEFSTFLRNPKITKITGSDVTRFQEALAKKGNSVRTIDNKISTIRAVLNFAKRQAYTREDNPAADRALLTKKQKMKGGYAIFEREEIDAFFRSEFFQERREDNPDYTNAVILGLFTGCRIGELTALQSEHVKTSPRGTHYIAIRDSKTVAGVRDVPLHPKVFALLKSFMTKNGKLFKYAGGNAAGKMFARNLAAANIHREKLVFHSLRKFTNNEMLNHGVSIEHRCQMMGHELDNVNVSIYSKKVSIDALADAVFPTLDSIYALIETSITYTMLDVSFIESSI